MHSMLCIGKIVNTHGVKGELKVIPLTDDITVFSELKDTYIEDHFYRMTNIRIHKDVLLVTLEGLDNKTDADKLIGKLLETEREKLRKLKEDQYYICDIIGLRIIDEDLGNIGTVNDIIKTGSNDVYVTKYKSKDVCIPAVSDVINEINIKEGYMKIKLPKGIIEE